MWAVLDKKTQIVIGILLPTATAEEIQQAENDYDLVLMTLENSPARIGDKYEDNKFISKGDINA
jgi:hypothetical protein